MFGRPKHHEKSTVVEDYAGLQVDTRPEIVDQANQAGRWRNNVAFTDEKETHAANPISPNSAHGDMNEMHGSSPLSPMTPGPPKTIDTSTDDTPITSPKDWPCKDLDLKREKTFCGIRRKRFWIIFSAILILLVIAGALIGGLVGGLSRKGSNQSLPPSNSSAPLPPAFPNAQRADVMIDSPLVVASFDTLGNTVDTQNKRQEFRVYFQSLFGNIKEAISSDSASWQTARPIFTDALNHTGLATYSYLNGSAQTGAVFYAGANGLLQEKRKVYTDDKYWQQTGGLNSNNIPMIGNLTTNVTNGDPTNDWDSYRIAAVYSRNFSTGPGARLFYHSQAINGSTFVQEMVWIQQNDSWTQGAVIPDANPGAHLAATIDESLGVLRLFYSTGNRSLQEVWTPLGQGNGKYTKTVRVDNFLSANNAEIAAVSANGTAYLYHYVTSQSKAGIRELVINSTSKSGPEKYNLDEPTVASPFLPGGNNASQYQTIGVGLTAVPELAPQFLLFWADTPTGNPMTNETGYNNLVQVSRPGGTDVWPSGKQLSIDLGNEDSDPHKDH